MILGVTGATGFIGRHLLSLAAESGLPSRILGREASGPGGTILMSGCTVVVHCAARAHVVNETAGDPLAAYRTANCALALSAYDAARSAGVGRFIFLSSIGVLGSRTGGHPFRDHDPHAPREPYAIAKAEAEVALTASASHGGPDLTILRPPLVHGPGVKGNFFRFLTLLSRTRWLPLGRARTNRRSFIGVENLSSAILTVAQRTEPLRGTFAVADDGVISTRRLIEILSLGLNVRPRLWPVPRWLMEIPARLIGQSGSLARLFDDLEVDDTGFRQAAGWRPRVALEEGLMTMAAAHAQGFP